MLIRDIPPINFYPDYAAFYSRLSRFMGIPADRIVVGQGIEGLVRDLFMLTCDSSSKVLFPTPTCAMFGLYAKMFRASPISMPVTAESPPTISDYVAAVDKGVRFVLLPNPGQPVDYCFEVEELRALAVHCQSMDCILAIDEAYYGFGAPTALPLVNEFDNVLVLRTFSKAFGAAALRVGFAVGQPRVLKPFEAVRQSGEVAGPSMHMATVLMAQWQTYVKPGINAIIRGRDWLRNRLEADGFVVRGTKSNHVLIDCGSPQAASGLAQDLAREQIRVRAELGQPLDNYMLVTCGTEQQMRAFYIEFIRLFVSAWESTKVGKTRGK